MSKILAAKATNGRITKIIVWSGSFGDGDIQITERLLKKSGFVKTSERKRNSTKFEYLIN